MLVWVAALHCEAKPVIDYYRLKKSTSHHAFDVYLKGNMLCIISGIGKTAAASAIAWIAGIYHDKGSIAWINIGTAGSATHPVGTALSINKISDNELNQHFYPVPLIDSDLEAAHCLTLNQASTDYHPRQIYDMEASAFFESATRFSSAELVHCIKIISDNPSRQTAHDKARISDMINHHIARLASFAQALLELNQQLSQREIKVSDWQKITGGIHFTQTQQIRVKKSLGYLLNQTYTTGTLFADISNLQSADKIISHLEDLCHQQSQDL